MIHTLNMTQALSLWSELEQCYYADHGFGGDIAEVYIYRLMPYVPSIAHNGPDVAERVSPMGEAAREAYDQANEALHDILKLFAQERNAQIEVEGCDLGAWLKTARHQHRVHIRVIPLGRSGNWRGGR